MKKKKKEKENQIRMRRFESREGVGDLIGYFDGAFDWDTGQGGWGSVLFRGRQRLLENCGYMRQTTLNCTELTGLIECLKQVAKFPGETCEIFGDSMLAINVVTGRWAVKAEHLKPLVIEARKILNTLDCLRLEWIPREHNEAADELSIEGIGLPEADLRRLGVN